jgi:hypothetical protein
LGRALRTLITGALRTPITGALRTLCDRFASIAA